MIKSQNIKTGKDEYQLMVYWPSEFEDVGEYQIKNIPDNVRWFAYAYSSGDYEGSGYGCAAFDDGTYRIVNMGHCSCYGPLDEAFAYGKKTNSGDLTYDALEQLIDKDINGKPIPTDSYGYSELVGMWKAVKKAIALNGDESETETDFIYV